MLKSLFIMGSGGEVVIERHWRGQTPRSVCDYFWDQVNKHESKIEVPPVLQMSQYYLISILRGEVFFLAPLVQESPPILVMELLHRIADTFIDYFGSCDETSLKDNFSLVYQILEEMLDYGLPLTTEPNALKAMIAPPSVMGRLTTMATGKSGVSDVLPDGTISSMPWRKAGVKYAQNDIYLDIIEEVDSIVDKSGQVISSEVTGSIQANCRLSGIPDMSLSFTDPEVIDDCSFHPCVRYNRFERDRVVSFVPPDGNFELMRYRVNAATNVAAPLYLTPQILLRDETNAHRGRIHLQLGHKATSSLVLPGSSSASLGAGGSRSASIMQSQCQIEDVVVEIPFPKCVKTATLNATIGTCLYDEASKVAKWTIGKLNPNSAKHIAQLSGSMVIQGNSQDAELPTIIVHWKVPAASVSGIQIAALQLTNEKYRPYKGVRTLTKSGRFLVRS